VVLFFGMMRPYKGIERLLRVWSQLRADQHATLRLVGPCPDSKYEDQLRRLVESSRSVEMQCGFVDDSKVAAQFAAADLAVLPFERVQTSGSVILALSFGLPVIAPRLGEVPDTLTGADDLLFEPGSDAALKQVLERALSVELTDLRRRSTAICDRLNWHSIGALTAGCYQTARKAGCPVYSA
jgi:glycosyltransferase involved in cell wall biosynthesis